MTRPYTDLTTGRKQMTREEALQEAVRAMRHERNCLARWNEARDALGVLAADWEAAKAESDKALKIVDDMQ